MLVQAWQYNCAYNKHICSIHSSTFHDCTFPEQAAKYIQSCYGLYCIVLLPIFTRVIAGGVLRLFLLNSIFGGIVDPFAHVQDQLTEKLRQFFQYFPVIDRHQISKLFLYL